MRRLLIRRLVVVGIGLVALITTVVSTVSVSAAPPQVFTNNGCAVGNYSCVQAAGGFRQFYRPYYAPYYPSVAYTAPVYIAPSYVVPVNPAPATVTASIVSGRTAAVGQATSLSLGGFTASESVMASITGPNGQVTQIGAAAASADGVVTITVTFPSAGSWQVAAHGQTSNKNLVSQYTVQ